MNFELFADYINQFLQSDNKTEKNPAVQFLLNLPWTHKDIFIANGHWGKPSLGAENLSAEILEEIKLVIYLCQGRFGQRYLQRFPPRRDKPQISSELRRIPFISNRTLSVANVWRQLNDEADSIFAWLNYQDQMPRQLRELVEGIQSEMVRDCVAGVLYGPLIDDNSLIEFVGLHLSAKGMGAAGLKQLVKIYRTTLPDLGLIAEIIWQKGIWGVIDSTLRPSLPTRPERIRMFENIQEAWRQTGPCYVQPKFNGWQVQIHKDNDRVWIFGRDLVDITDRLQGLAAVCQLNIKAKSVILDGEVLLDDVPQAYPQPVSELKPSETSRIIVFDLLHLDETDYRKEPYRKRKIILTDVLTGISPRLSLAAEKYVTDEKAFLSLWQDTVTNSANTGIVVKLPRALYNSAGWSDGKWKVKNYLSLDFVVLGYRLSSNGKGIFLMGAWDEENEKYVPVGEIDAVKASDEVNTKILETCKLYQTEQMPANVSYSIVPRVVVHPRIVIEIITNGNRIKDDRFFNAGSSCLPPFDQKSYFPRPDKSPEDVNTLSDFLSLKLIAEDPEQKIPRIS